MPFDPKRKKKGDGLIVYEGNIFLVSWPWSVCFSIIAVDMVNLCFIIIFLLGITAPFCSTPAKRGRKECLNDRIDQSSEVSFDRYCLYNMF